MKKPPLVLALWLVAATPSFAQINLAWRSCITFTTGPNAALANFNWACDGSGSAFPGTAYKAVVSFIAPADITDLVGTATTFEVSTSSPVLPDYWRHDGFGCRSGSFVAGFTGGLGTGTTGACQDPYEGTVTFRSSGYWSEIPALDRATFSVQLYRETGRPLTAGQHYLANAVNFDTNHDADTGDGVCTGCSIPACLAVKHLWLLQSTPLPNHILIAPDVRKFITWQGGTPNCAGATPVRNHTWGAIKAVYR